MKNFNLPQDLLEKIANYMAKKPFIEVVELMGALQGLKEVSVVPKNEEDHGKLE